MFRRFNRTRANHRVFRVSFNGTPVNSVFEFLSGEFWHVRLFSDFLSPIGVEKAQEPQNGD